VVRQQLLVHESIPYTSHNSSACVVVEMPELDFLHDLVSRALQHLESHALDDLGLHAEIFFGLSTSQELLAYQGFIHP
jgi:hypothetical protein